MPSALITLPSAALLLLNSCNGPMPRDAITNPELAMDERMVSAYTDFGLRLFHQVRQAEGEANIFLSPTSVAFALSMAHNGAAGETQQAIARTLGVQSLTPQELNRSNAAWLASLGSVEPDVQLRVANSLWARQGVPFNDAFLESTRAHYRAEVSTLDFGDPGATGTINRWVASSTNDRIPEIVDRIDPNEILFLINAVYFKGLWTHPFDRRMTRDGEFTTASGERIEHPMMTQTGQFRHLRGEGFQAAALPYGEEGRLSMYLFLPDQGRTLESFYAQLTPESWERWLGEFRETRLQLSIPRFRMEYALRMNEALQAMGMQVAFDPARADFGGMLPREFLQANNAYITRVQHKTFVEVNEEGTEAAAATSVGVGIVSMPPQFTADRPFFVAIRDDRTGTLLFLGQIMDPR